MRKPFFFAYAKTKTQTSFSVTAHLISAFVFATHIVQFPYFLHSKLQVSSHLLWLYSLVCVGPGRKPRRPVFSQRGSSIVAEVLKPIGGNNTVEVRHPHEDIIFEIPHLHEDIIFEDVLQLHSRRASPLICSVANIFASNERQLQGIKVMKVSSMC